MDPWNKEVDTANTFKIDNIIYGKLTEFVA